MTTTGRKSRTSDATRKARAEKAQADRTALFAKLDEFLAQNEDQEDLVLEARIATWETKYSRRNSELIVMQAPNATDLRGYRQWQAEGRQVLKGATGVRIMAPSGQGNGVEAAPATKDTPAVEGKEGRRFFKLISVFDISQTAEINEDCPAWDMGLQDPKQEAGPSVADLLNA